MEIAFRDRRVGWRGRGRPPRQPSDKTVTMLRQTATTGKVAVLTLEAGETFSPDQLRELKADLRAAQRVLGGEVHFQQVGAEFRFFWTP